MDYNPARVKFSWSIFNSTKLTPRRQTLATFAVLGLLTIFAYGNSLQVGFVFDDSFIIANNPLITHLANIPTLFTADYWEGHRDPREVFTFRGRLYRPLVVSTYAVNYALGGLNPFGYHLVNVILHLAVTWVLYVVAIE
ncbi:MAG: hypothetical protein HY695_38985, partial [Deltaproteobacteria bacterium]|nr:hypothetical protein [Deltaproteobacteria bacterium]